MRRRSRRTCRSGRRSPASSATSTRCSARSSSRSPRTASSRATWAGSSRSSSASPTTSSTSERDARGGRRASRPTLRGRQGATRRMERAHERPCITTPNSCVRCVTTNEDWRPVVRVRRVHGDEDRTCADVETRELSSVLALNMPSAQAFQLGTGARLRASGGQRRKIQTAIVTPARRTLCTRSWTPLLTRC